ncbi:MAG: hypothetical protein R3A12_04240 [Ignavibacteria bacterium]
MNYSSVTLLIIFSVIQATVTSLFLFIPYIRKNHIRINLNLKENLKTLKEAYKLGLANKAEGITSSFIILSAGIILNEQAVGYYNASNKIYLILLTVVQGLSYTLMPVLLKSVKKNEERNVNKLSLIFYMYLFTGIILSLLTYFFSDTIISVMFGEKFSRVCNDTKTIFNNHFALANGNVQRTCDTCFQQIQLYPDNICHLYGTVFDFFSDIHKLIRNYRDGNGAALCCSRYNYYKLCLPLKNFKG